MPRKLKGGAGDPRLGGLTIEQLKANYAKFNDRQLKTYPTFDKYLEANIKRNENRLKGNELGAKANANAEQERLANNQAYDEYIKENPEMETRKINGKLMTKGEYLSEVKRKSEEKYEREHPIQYKFARDFAQPVVQGLTDFADNAIDIVPVPKAVKALYKNFAPPTSKFYDRNLLKQGSGKNSKPYLGPTYELLIGHL